MNPNYARKYVFFLAGWQKLCEGTKGLGQKLWTRTKTSSLNIRYFVATLRFVVIYALFGNLWAKSVFLGQEIHYYMVGRYCKLY